MRVVGIGNISRRSGYKMYPRRTVGTRKGDRLDALGGQPTLSSGRELLYRGSTSNQLLDQSYNLAQDREAFKQWRDVPVVDLIFDLACVIENDLR